MSPFPIKMKLSFWRSSTDDVKGFTLPLDRKIVPVREAGCGIGVSVGVFVGVLVGSGELVDVGKLVAVGILIY